MPKVRKQNVPLTEQITDFERLNPQIADAMKLFGMTMVKYQNAFHPLTGPRIYQSNSTARIDNPKQ